MIILSTGIKPIYTSKGRKDGKDHIVKNSYCKLVNELIEQVASYKQSRKVLARNRTGA